MVGRQGGQFTGIPFAPRAGRAACALRLLPARRGFFDSWRPLYHELPRTMALRCLLGVIVLSQASGHGNVKRRLGRNNIIHATNPDRASSVKHSQPRVASQTSHSEANTKKFALVPNPSCSGKVKLCYEGDDHLLTIIQQDDSFNPCHGKGSNVRQG